MVSFLVGLPSFVVLRVFQEGTGLLAQAETCCRSLISKLPAGFEKPSAIQQRGIVPFAKGHDVIQQAQSGTGKTATFCAGILQNLDYSILECQALVLAPTRELAQQIEKVMRALGDYLQVKCHACVGGTSVREDTRILQGGVHVVVGTPGRVYDMLRRQALRADYIKMFVLDEADEMLSRGFKDQIYEIFQLLPSKLQVSPYLKSACRACMLYQSSLSPLPGVHEHMMLS